MPLNADTIAINIRNIREKQGMNQEQFANKLGIARPTISNWENGKAVPTTEQLLKIATTFNESIDRLVGLNITTSRWVVPDTSALIKRPRLIDELCRRFDKVIIAPTVVSELNGLKDHNPHVQQQAWLAMSSIISQRKTEHPVLEIVDEEDRSKTLNDDRIIDLAIRKAQANSGVMVYVLSDDVYFSVQANRPGVRFLSLFDYDDLIHDEPGQFDIKRTLDFYQCVKNGDVEKARRIYDKQLVDPNKLNVETGFSPLLAAVRNKDLAMIDYLLSLPEVDINKCDDKKYCLPPISHAIQMKQFAIAKKLVEGGCDVDKGSEGKNSGNTPLMIACWHGLDDFVKLLLMAGACVNQQDTNGYTALMKCCIRGHPGTAKLVLKDTDGKIRSREGKTAKDYAYIYKNKELKDLFIGGVHD